MTDTQAKKIRKLRMKGLGYRAIASEVGLSRDIVRKFCKTHGLKGYAPVLVLNLNEQIEQGKVCLNCGREIEQPPTGRKKKFCSEKCRRSWWAAHPEELKKDEGLYFELTCSYCGKPFRVYGNKARKYCCHDCYVRDRFQRFENEKPHVGEEAHNE